MCSENYIAWEEELNTPCDEELEGLCPSEIDAMIEDPCINIWADDEYDEEEFYDEEEY